jgi:hypothetical protein
MRRENKDRRFPGERGPRPDNAKIKREEAVARAAAWERLSIKDKLAVLDARLGPGQGAQRQRARLMAEFERPKTVATEKTASSQEKNLKAKDRRAQERGSDERE